MKPPLFIECSVCGREFGSKSIVIHEPQCLQKLRRTEILQRERETAPNNTTGNGFYNGKKNRRRKKVVLEKRREEQVETTTSTTTMVDNNRATGPGPGPTSFVLLATSSSSTSSIVATTTSTEKLPKIQSSTSVASFKIRRPCTAKLDKPRILNPDYIQYDMSLTRIDFTGQTKSSTGVSGNQQLLDENQNSRLQRQNTQVLDNSQQRTTAGFILPTVDGTSILPKYYNNPGGKNQRSSAADFVTTNNSKLVPCCANIMTTVDSVLGDPQKKSRDQQQRGGGETLLIRDSATEFSDKSSSSSPPIESLFAAPNFLTKISQCDLEKPLPNDFHLDKMPGQHRPAFESVQDHLVTPTTSSAAAETEWFSPGPVPDTSTDDDHHHHQTTETTTFFCHCPQIIPCHQNPRKDHGPCDRTPHSYQPELEKLYHVQQQQLQRQQPGQSEEKTCVRFDNQVHESTTTTTTTTKKRTTVSKEVIVLKDVTNSSSSLTNSSVLKSQNGPDQEEAPELNNDVPILLLEELTKSSVPPNWIGQPFMTAQNYYSVPQLSNDFNFNKKLESESDSSESYSTPMKVGSDQEGAQKYSGQHEEQTSAAATGDEAYPSILSLIEELQEITNKKIVSRLKMSDQIPPLYSKTLSSSSSSSKNMSKCKCSKRHDGSGVVVIEANDVDSRLFQDEDFEKIIPHEKELDTNNSKNKGKSEQTFSMMMEEHHTVGGENARPRRPPFLSHPSSIRTIIADSLEDSVAVWEGSDIIVSDNLTDRNYSDISQGENLSSHDPSVPLQLPLIDIVNQEPLPPRPPTRRRQSPVNNNNTNNNEFNSQQPQLLPQPDKNYDNNRSSSDRDGSKTEKKLKHDSKKIQNLISNVCRLHELQKQKVKKIDTTQQQQRPKTSPPSYCRHQPLLTRPTTAAVKRPASANRPSTCIPMIPLMKDKVGRLKSSQSNEKTKIPRSKRSLSKSAAIKVTTTTTTTPLAPMAMKSPLLSNRRRPATATAAFSSTANGSGKPTTTTKTRMTLNTAIVGLHNNNYNFGKTTQIYNKFKTEQRPHSSRAPSSFSSPYSTTSPTTSTTDDESPLELIYSFKSKTPRKKRTKSPMGLCSPRHLCDMSQLDKANFYTQIELQRREVVTQQQEKQSVTEAKLVNNNNKSNKNYYYYNNNNNNYSESTSYPSSPTPPASISPKTKQRQTAAGRLLMAKQVLRKLSEQKNKKQQQEEIFLSSLSATSLLHVPQKRSPSKIRKTRSKATKIRTKLLNMGEEITSIRPRRSNIPIPMSKRVQFSSPVRRQWEGPEGTVSKKSTKKVSKLTTGQQQSPRPNSGKNIDDKKKRVKIIIQASQDAQGKLKLSCQKQNGGDCNNVEKEIISNKFSSANNNDNNNRKRISAPCRLPTSTEQPTSQNVEKKDQNMFKEKELRETLEKLEDTRERVRGKDFERQKRDRMVSKGGRRDGEHGASTVSMILPKKHFTDDKMLNVKIIVRRKNPDGTMPAIDNVIQNFTTKWTYLIVDEQPLTRSSPNPYLASHHIRPKTKKVDDNNFYSLKITTSDQSTIDSLPSEEALSRFLTCYVCGKSFNVRDYPQHERECVHDIKEKNELLEPDEQRILPPKPQGTITIKNWNMFAYESLKDKYVRCPFCKMEFFPDKPEEVYHHDEFCLERLTPTHAASLGVWDLLSEVTVQKCDESCGWIVPTTKELRRGDWGRGAERAAHHGPRYKPYKKKPKDLLSLKFSTGNH